tara:strand:- start:2264 stop:4687 length:2424 start_codon:yes stop_codon:yes gene_type:complete
MSYRNPSSTVDTTLGDAFIKQIKGVSSGISETMSKYATMAAANKQRNFELTKKINQYESEVSSNVAKVATENKVNSESLLSGLEPRTKEFKEAAARYEMAKEPYEGMEEDAIKIREFENFTNYELGQQLAAKESVFSSFNDAMLKGGMDAKGGSISSSTDPRLLAMINVERPGNNTNARNSYEVVGNDVLYVTSGPEIAQLNKEMGIEGDSYKISTRELKEQTTAKGVSPNNYHIFNTVPDLAGDGSEDGVGIAYQLQQDKVIDKGEFTKEYSKSYGKQLRSEKVEGGQNISILVDRKAVDIGNATAAITPSVNATMNTWLGFKGPEIFDYIRTNVKETKEINGKKYYVHNSVKGRNAKGDVEYEKVLMSEDELVRDFTKYPDNGYSEEMKNKIRKVGVDDALKLYGALNKPTETKSNAPEYVRGKPRGQRAESISSEIQKNSALAKEGRYEEIDFPTLQGIEDAPTFQVKNDKSGSVDVFDKDNEFVLTMNLNTDEGASLAERNLLDIFGQDIEGVIKPGEKMPKAAIVKDLINPIKNIDSDVSEENFMDNLSGGYLKRLSKLGIGLEETNIGSDALLLTKPNGDEVEIDLEEDGWKDVYAKEMESAIKMSPEYEGFVNEEKNPPKKQEAIIDVDRIKKLDLSSVSKNKKVEGKPSDSKSSSESGFMGKLAMSESSNNHLAKITDNKGRKFVGKYQFGEARLKDYKEATGESFTQEEFRLDPNLQDKVANWHFEGIDKKIDSLGDLTKGYSRDGLRAVAHLGGKYGMEKWLKGKEKLLTDEDGKLIEYTPSDSLGTSLDKYYNKFK